MTDGSRRTATDWEPARDGGSASRGDGVDRATQHADRTAQHASADVAPELFGW